MFDGEVCRKPFKGKTSSVCLAKTVALFFRDYGTRDAAADMSIDHQRRDSRLLTTASTRTTSAESRAALHGPARFSDGISVKPLRTANRTSYGHEMSVDQDTAGDEILAAIVAVSLAGFITFVIWAIFA